MPFAVIEDKIAGISPKYQGELVAFIDFLLYKQSSESGRSDISPFLKNKGKRKIRQLGGFEKDFYMAPDFDEPLQDFAEYMQ